MGACQNQFESVPQLASYEYQRQQNRFSTNSINLEHKAARANTRNVTIGIIDTKLQSYKSQQLLNSQFQEFGATSIEFSPNKSATLLKKDSVMKPILKGKQLDRQQLHATQRPFQQTETIKLSPQQKVMKINNVRGRQALDLTFYHSLGLPEYVYKPIQSEYLREFQNLIMRQQQDRNGVKYIGEWKDEATVHGNGIMQSNTTKYIGQFKNGLKHFHGRQIQKYEVYQGMFQNGRRKGLGKRYTQECQEEGIFDQNLTEGTITYLNGNKYHGKVQNNYYNGNGCFIDKMNNIQYQGNFKNGKLNGKGKITSINNQLIYEGDFKQGLKHGEGIFYWSLQQYYQGSYSRGKKHGKGKLYKKNVCYQGPFSNGKMNGQFNIYKKLNNTWQFAGKSQFNNGIRVVQDQFSISSNDTGLPREWREVIQKSEQIYKNQSISVNQGSSLNRINSNSHMMQPVHNILLMQQPQYHLPVIPIQRLNQLPNHRSVLSIINSNIQNGSNQSNINPIAPSNIVNFGEVNNNPSFMRVI